MSIFTPKFKLFSADYYPNLGRGQPGCDGDMLGKLSKEFI